MKSELGKKIFYCNNKFILNKKDDERVRNVMGQLEN